MVYLSWVYFELAGLEGQAAWPKETPAIKIS
jgi:hypothetical protein